MFIFWLLWPYIVARVTREMCQRYTGRVMPKADVIELRKNLSAVKPYSRRES